ncbi:MAG: SGNH/GDSL hydrolase family protein [Bacteroidales bacterium]|nr:SGNH/GDSL hydrolase family protein [Bacteroidales bacterium]
MKRTLAILYILMLSIAAVAQDTLHQDINVIIFGDSNTWLGGDNCAKPKGWNTYFKQEFAARSCVSLARSGATWTNTPYTAKNTTEYTNVVSHCNVIYNQVQRLIEQTEKDALPIPDVILIAAGTNDGWFAPKRPNALSKSAEEALADSTLNEKPISKITTLAESVVYSTRILQERFPLATIVLLTPMQTIQVKDSTIEQIGDIIEQCAEGLGVFVIRQDKETPIVAAKERLQRKYTYDGTHTSELGARENGKLIAQKVSEFLQTIFE